MMGYPVRAIVRWPAGAGKLGRGAIITLGDCTSFGGRSEFGNLNSWRQLGLDHTGPLGHGSISFQYCIPVISYCVTMAIYYIKRNVESQSNVHAVFPLSLTTLNFGNFTAQSQPSSETACFLGVPLADI